MPLVDFRESVPVIVLGGVPHFPNSQVPVHQIFVVLSNLIPLPFQKKVRRIQEIVYDPLLGIIWGQPGLCIIQDSSANTEGKTGEGEQGTGTSKDSNPEFESCEIEMDDCGIEEEGFDEKPLRVDDNQGLALLVKQVYGFGILLCGESLEPEGWKV